MTEAAAGAIWTGVGGYAAIGLLAALAIVLFGLRRIDPVAAVAPVRVKLLIVPGLVVLWPLMLRRLAGVRPAEDRS